EDFEMDVKYTNDKGDTTMAFISQSNMKNGDLTVMIKEFYTKITYLMEMYSDFRKVFNAAADMNKKTAILERKE
ncbi:MAG: hypothetical protein ABEH43_10105, partial [Flavobacteriales bacterium]